MAAPFARNITPLIDGVVALSRGGCERGIPVVTVLDRQTGPHMCLYLVALANANHARGDTLRIAVTVT
jgi:hypothetical protein